MIELREFSYWCVLLGRQESVGAGFYKAERDGAAKEWNWFPVSSSAQSLALGSWIKRPVCTRKALLY